MDRERIRHLAADLGCACAEDESLARHLTIGIGGGAAFGLWPRDWAQAERLLLALWEDGTPFKVLAGGSNLMAADGPLPFGVVHLARLGGRVRWEQERAEADADVPMPVLVSESVRHGLRGLEGMGGVPGTVGGAVIMNAGAFGNDMSGVLSGVALIERGVGLRWHDPSAFTFAYRRTDVASRGIVAACRLAFEPGDAAELKARFDEVKARRQSTQPWREATAGSVFKNPPGTTAGRVLEELGFKGKRRGEAGFSTLHANFLVNHGGATFEDAFALCEEARAAAEKAGVVLDYEMEMWR